MLKNINNLSTENQNTNSLLRWPSSGQWRQFLRISSFVEKIVLAFFGFVLLVGLGILGNLFYLKSTQIVPANGGVISIAMVGSPRFLNPILSQLNGIDRDLAPVFFSGLMKASNEGNLIPDLAEKYAIGEEGKIYDITLRPNLKWHDDQPLTIDDVIFTLQLIQNPEFNSPLRPLWQGAEFEKMDEQTIRFRLNNPYAPFLNTLTFGILPKHIWESVTANRFPLTEFNLKPVGSGPYSFVELTKDKDGKIKSLSAESFKDYFLGKPYISTVIFHFYDSEEQALGAYKIGEVAALNSVSPKTESEIVAKSPGLTVYPIKLPRYFAVFFNQSQNSLLAEKSIRQALAYAVDKNELIEKVLLGLGGPVDTAIQKGMTGFSPDAKTYEFDPQKATDILIENGWSATDEEGYRLKDDRRLEITLTTNDWPDLVQTAEIIQAQWQTIGVKTNLEIKETAKIQNESIKPRQYQALLFGEVLGLEPDPFSFWHSSQKKDPGLNLAIYENPEADRLLLEARQSLDQTVRNQKYQEFVNLVAGELPAIFLYSPDYLFAAAKEIKNIKFENINNLSTQFSQINQWFINTKRAWK